ncbi:uncharacterized protein LOC112494509 isoform X2 [Cephus cinctus]|uniref:Uncharacterized protein LOC112494509 isoform X2 n=1 Tax=Cephus cinctus TaxID=211228 RepID=A0AAJ7RJU7_CEPCN|nr:uncharacterized protein LOC112494509 isoform X2 [Cephus cinctus]
MVRVIPVHNFLGQSVAQIDEPTAFCTANESANELLFLALRTHCIEVYLLNNPDLKRLTTFPTVDLAEYILHCAKGEYIATMEAKGEEKSHIISLPIVFAQSCILHP